MVCPGLWCIKVQVYDLYLSGCEVSQNLNGEKLFLALVAIYKFSKVNIEIKSFYLVNIQFSVLRNCYLEKWNFFFEISALFVDLSTLGENNTSQV